MRIVFMGTPDFALPSLRALLDAGHEVAAVFCQPDKPAGRGHKLTPPPVKQLAEEKQIPVFQPESFKKGDAVEILRSLSPELAVVVAYGKLLPAAALEIPKRGCINVHGSLLPKYRGAAPIQWSVLNGDEYAGVTTMQLNEGMDTGDMLLQAKTPIGANETSGELFDRLSVLGAELLIQTISAVEEGRLCPQKQAEEEASYAPMLSRGMAELDWANPAPKLHHLICGLSPWPCAQTTLQGKRLKLYKSELCAEQSGKPGELLSDRELIVACGSGAIKLAEVQEEGGRRMDGGAFLRGKHFSAGEILFG